MTALGRRREKPVILTLCSDILLGIVQVQTATLIMYSNKIYFPQRHSPEWKDFVRVSLEKNPHLRPSAATLLDHPWIRYA